MKPKILKDPASLQYILFDRDEVQIFVQKPDEMDALWSLYVGPEGGYLSVSKLALTDVMTMIEKLQNVAADMISHEKRHADSGRDIFRPPPRGQD